VLRLPASVRIFLAAAPTDMRKGFDGLSALVKARGADVFSGHLFVFVSRRGDRVKVLTWDRGGFVLWYKRLERGRFRMPAMTGDEESVELDSGQLSMLLDGVDLSRVRRQRVWEPRRRDATGIDRRKTA
jgi:transposase